MSYLRTTVVAKMQSWIGKKEADGSHKSIIDIYNKISPLPVGYKMSYSDAWCAAAVSAAFHAVGYDAIFPSECSCGRMIDKAKKMGIWVENDAYVPKPGDCILYDWDDSGVGDNTGAADHIGMVEKVEGNTMTIIEGNCSHMVKRRGIAVNARFIRGFITPKFTESGTASTSKTETPTTNKTTYSVGDVVKFTGTKHYTSANSTSAKTCKPGIAKVTQVYQLGKSKHPYHLIATGADNSNVYGWVDIADIEGATATTTPKQETVKPAETKVEEKKTTVTKKVKAKAYAMGGPDKKIAGTYTTTADLNIRDGGGMSYKILGVLPNGTVVHNYGYYTGIWYYVVATVGNTEYTGFVSKNYLKEV